MTRKMRSKPMLRYAKTVFRAIKAATTAGALEKATEEYYIVAGSMLYIRQGLAWVKPNGYRAIKGGDTIE